MAISKTKKEEIIRDLNRKLAQQKSIIFADFTGLKVKDLCELKTKLRRENAEFKVAKKTLMRLALKENEIDFDPHVLNGELALVMGYGDQTAPAKTLYEFSKTNEKLKILGGILENNVLSIPQVLNLAQLPSKQELLAKAVGSISAPPRNLVNVLQGNIRNLINVLSQIKK